MLPVALVLVPLGAALLLVLLPGVGDWLARPVGVVAGGATLALGVVAACRVDLASSRPGDQLDVAWLPSLGVRLHLGIDGISLPLLLLTALLFLLCLVHLVHHLPAPGHPRALVALLLVLEAGSMATFLALDLVVFFLAFEVVLLPLWFLVAVWGGGPRARQAATTMLLMTLAGSLVMLVGFLLVGSAAGTTDLVALAARHGSGLARGTQVVAAVAMLGGLAVKTPVWPLHTWLPGAHSEAPTVGSVLLAGVLLKLGTYGMVRCVLPVVPQGARVVAPALAALAVVGALWGPLACLAQRDVKRLVAYSSVGHMGFVVLGIATLTATGVQAALVGNVAHGLITGLLFFLVGALKERRTTADIAAVGPGLAAQAPLLGGLLVLAGYATLGLPGLAGFWGEALALVGAWAPGTGLSTTLFRSLAVLAVVGALLTAGYALWLVHRVVLGAVPEPRRRALLPDATTLELAVWTPLVVGAVAVGIDPRLVLGYGQHAVAALLAGSP